MKSTLSYPPLPFALRENLCQEDNIRKLRKVAAAGGESESEKARSETEHPFSLDARFHGRT